MIRVEKIIPGGMALGTLEDGKKIFFWNALPGEKVVEFNITKNKHRFTEAVATKIINPSPHRVKPLDDCFLSTSPWQIMDYGYELVQKSALIQEIFREHGVDITPPSVITDDRDYHYRNKMEYSLYYDHADAKIHLAFHARGSHGKIPISQSSLEKPEIFARATEIVNDLNARHEEARKYQSLLLRANTKGEVSGGLYENGQPHPVFSNLTDTILGHEYSYSPNGFFQINLPVYELALKEIQKHITTDDVLDLYAGVGTIGLSCARDRHLTLVEVDKSAYVELERNCLSAATVGFENVVPAAKLAAGEGAPRKDGRATGFEKPAAESPQAILDKSENSLNYIRPSQTIILDPPRAGLHVNLVEKLLEITPEKIIYLSCNPATQARDVKMLLDKYKITFIKSFNFFPRTPHIENLIVLSL